MPRFDVSISAVEDLVWVLYGLRADPKTPTRELQSYADRNFLITLNDHLPLLPDNARPNHGRPELPMRYDWGQGGSFISIIRM